MRQLVISIVCAFALPLLAYADTPVYQVEKVDVAQSVLTLKSSTMQDVVLHVLPGANITISGSDGALGDLQPGMKVTVQLAEPGVVQAIDATGVATGPATAPIPSVDAMPDSAGIADFTGVVAKATIRANTPNGFLIKNVRKGMKITLHYIGGGWKAGGTLADHCPDNSSGGSNDADKLAIAVASTPGNIGETLAVLPWGTKIRGFVFEAQQDYPALALRINSKGFHGPGQVQYDLHIVPPQD